MNFKLSLLVIIVLSVFLTSAVYAEVFGADSIQIIGSSRAVSGAAASDNALAGNVTEMNITGNSITRSWQGYYGNVTGSLLLADSSGNVMYNWSVASPRGQVYSSTTNGGITWSSLRCYDFVGDDVDALNTVYGMQARDDDNINNTFQYTNHREFYVGSIDIAAGTCPSTRVYGASGSQNANEFEEAITTDGGNVVWTSLLNEDLNGFDSKTHDFEMLVPENGHGADTATTPYYFYVEFS